jgi:hypothetical protein
MVLHGHAEMNKKYILHRPAVAPSFSWLTFQGMIAADSQ